MTMPTFREGWGRHGGCDRDLPGRCATITLKMRCQPSGKVGIGTEDAIATFPEGGDGYEEASWRHKAHSAHSSASSSLFLHFSQQHFIDLFHILGLWNL